MDYSTITKDVNDRLKALSMEYSQSTIDVILNRLNSFSTEMFSNIEYEIKSEFKKKCKTDIVVAKKLFDDKFVQIRKRKFCEQVNRYSTTDSDNNSEYITELEAIIRSQKGVSGALKDNFGSENKKRNVIEAVIDGVVSPQYQDGRRTRPGGRDDKKELMYQLNDSIKKLDNMMNKMKATEDKGKKNNRTRLFEDFNVYINEIIVQYKDLDEMITIQYMDGVELKTQSSEQLSSEESELPDYQLDDMKTDAQTKPKSLFDYL